MNPLRILTQLHSLVSRIRDLELESLTVTSDDRTNTARQ